MGLTLTEIRQALGIELRDFQPSTSGSASTKSTVVDPTSPFQTQFGIGDENFDDYTNWYLFRPSAASVNDQQRRVRTYHGPTGTFQVDRPYTNAPTSEAYELWNVGLTLDQIHGCINQSLRRLFIRDRFWLVPPTDTIRGSFLQVAVPSDVQNWLTNQKHVLQMGMLVEGPKNAASLSASAPGSVDYASVIATFKRDRAKGAIRRVQSTTGTDSLELGTINIAAPQIVTEGNLLVLGVTVHGTGVTTPAGWTLIASASKNNTFTALYYRFPVTHGSGLSNFTITYSYSGGAPAGVATFAEYQGLRPGGLDVSSSASGTSATLVSGTTAAAAEGDELWVAVLGAGLVAGAINATTLFNPTNRFSLVANPLAYDTTYTASHGFYERIIPVTDLQDRHPSPIEGQRFDPIQEEQGVVVLYPQQPIVAPNFYIVDALRSLYTYCRVDGSGHFGTKLDGLTAETNQVEGDAESGLRDAIVAGAMVYAWERIPSFRAMADRERQQKISLARHRFLSYQRASQPQPTKRFKYREPVGLF